MVALPKDASNDAIKQCMVEERRSRILIYEGTLDNVLGYVSA